LTAAIAAATTMGGSDTAKAHSAATAAASVGVMTPL
jgi:hypothetical protein